MLTVELIVNYKVSIKKNKKNNKNNNRHFQIFFGSIKVRDIGIVVRSGEKTKQLI